MPLIFVNVRLGGKWCESVAHTDTKHEQQDKQVIGQDPCPLLGLPDPSQENIIHHTRYHVAYLRGNKWQGEFHQLPGMIIRCVFQEMKIDRKTTNYLQIKSEEEIILICRRSNGNIYTVMPSLIMT